ncbi:hypothetical protein KCU61_g267, partial [Aureobasidium melanogenum]
MFLGRRSPELSGWFGDDSHARTVLVVVGLVTNVNLCVDVTLRGSNGSGRESGQGEDMVDMCLNRPIRPRVPKREKAVD